MRRRDFLGIFGATTAAWPLIAQAQQRPKLPTIGFMGAGTPSSWSRWTAAFVDRLSGLGWIEGKTVAIEYRWAEGSGQRYEEIAAEFVRLEVNVLVLVGGDAAKQATSTIPIVVALMADPVGTGLVSNLARPGGNITGMSIQSIDLAGKRLEILREVLPGLRRLAALAYVDYKGTMLEVGEVYKAAKALDLEVATLAIHNANDIELAFGGLKTRTEAIYVPPNLLVNTNRVRINQLALREQLPTMHGFREYVDSGGLISYGPNTPKMFQRAAEYVDKILRGAKPGDLPIQQPTEFELVVNLKTAKAIGLAVSPTLLARADKVIE
jgi:putative tryptophan/tyrosine transport system substrate-binding protein